MTKISLINLGCPKNTVDSEIILGLLKKSDMKISNDAESADVMLLNTCAFIKEAKEESVDAILELSKIKARSPEKKIIVIGCLVQRYLKGLQKELPEVDYWLTLQEIPELPNIINKILNQKMKKSENLVPIPSSFLNNKNIARQNITPSHYGYIKIAEGCSNRCSYCAVPNIKGPYVSKQPDSVISEVKKLVKRGVKEINLIAQDTTSYGIDISNTINVTLLLRELCKIKNLKWIRLLYVHPAHITDDLIHEIANQKKICKYIDLPLQHIDDAILRYMCRKVNSLYIKNLINKIRNQIPNVILRTSFIIGFPGETEEKFKRLLSFMKKIKFDRLGIFKYSREEGTPAYKMPNQIPERIKEKRYHIAMQLQNSIAKKINKKFLGQTIDVLVEKPKDKNTWIGRSYADAPEVDGVVYINTTNLKKGDIIRARVIDTLDYDLIAKKVSG